MLLVWSGLQLARSHLKTVGIEGTLHLGCASGEFLRTFLLDPKLPSHCQWLLICPVFQKCTQTPKTEVSTACNSWLVKVLFGL